MPIEVVPAFRALAISLALGLLVGMQRQRSQSLVAGVRTFALVTILGTCCAFIATALGGAGAPSLAGASPAPQVSEPESVRGTDGEIAQADDELAAGSGDVTPSDRGGAVGESASDGGTPADTDSREGSRQAPFDDGDDGTTTGGAATDARRAIHAVAGSGAWILAAGALCIVALAVLGNLIAVYKGEGDPGMSTEVAMVVMYAVGALAWLAPPQVAAAVGIGAAILLHAKDTLHRFTERLGEKDVRAVLTFALITFIILPVVPNETYGPFDVLNPRETWRMVVLVVGISLAGYVAAKLVGRSNGAIVSGLMGGLVSSTATTASAARQTKGGSERAENAPGQNVPERAARQFDNLAATIIMLATVVMYGRVLVEVAVVARGSFAAIAPPIGVLMGVTLILSVVMWLRSRRNGAEMPETQNPAQLKPAIIFGLLYAVVIFIAAAGQHYLGSGGLYAVAAISGLTDMDAITLSSGRLVQDGRLEPQQAANAILIAATANMVFKTGMIASLGSRGLRRRVAVLYGVCAAVALGLVLLWPA